MRTTLHGIQYLVSCIVVKFRSFFEFFCTQYVDKKVEKKKEADNGLVWLPISSGGYYAATVQHPKKTHCSLQVILKRIITQNGDGKKHLRIKCYSGNGDWLSAHRCWLEKQDYTCYTGEELKSGLVTRDCVFVVFVLARKNQREVETEKRIKTTERRWMENKMPSISKISQI